jgi:hypothetical protein
VSQFTAVVFIHAFRSMQWVLIEAYLLLDILGERESSPDMLLRGNAERGHWSGLQVPVLI